jgi:hypothetical protein
MDVIQGVIKPKSSIGSTGAIMNHAIYWGKNKPLKYLLTCQELLQDEKPLL